MADERIDETPSKFDPLDGPAADRLGQKAPAMVPSLALTPRPAVQPSASTPPVFEDYEDLLGPAPVALTDPYGDYDDLLGPAPVLSPAPSIALVVSAFPDVVQVTIPPSAATQSIEDHPDYDPNLGEIAPRPDSAADADMPAYVERFNRKHAVIAVGGKMRIARYDDSDRRYVFYGKDDFMGIYDNDQVPKPGSAATWSRAQAWFQHPLRTTYGGVVFDPVHVDQPGAEFRKLNLWTGFAIDPDPTASCELFLRHLREVIASNQQEYDYLLGWLAHMVQKPQEIPAVAVILKGDKGSGKDTIGEYMAPFLGSMRVNLGNQQALFTNFNKHFENCLFMQLQEAYWAGDKRHESVLKSIVTSTTTHIEPKGLDGYTVKSILRLLMTSNAEQVVPVSMDERRYFILKVRNVHMQETGWFDPLYKERDIGGAAALLHLLMNHDIS